MRFARDSRLLALLGPRSSMVVCVDEDSASAPKLGLVRATRNERRGGSSADRRQNRAGRFAVLAGWAEASTLTSPCPRQRRNAAAPTPALPPSRVRALRGGGDREIQGLAAAQRSARYW